MTDISIDSPAGNVWSWVMTDKLKPAFMIIFFNSWYVCIAICRWSIHSRAENVFFNEDTTAFSIWHMSGSPQVLHSSLWVGEVITLIAVFIGKIPCVDFKFVHPVMAIWCMLSNYADLLWNVFIILVITFCRRACCILRESKHNCPPRFISPRASILSILMKWS